MKPINQFFMMKEEEKYKSKNTRNLVEELWEQTKERLPNDTEEQDTSGEWRPTVNYNYNRFNFLTTSKRFPRVVYNFGDIYNKNTSLVEFDVNGLIEVKGRFGMMIKFPHEYLSYVLNKEFLNSSSSFFEFKDKYFKLVGSNFDFNMNNNLNLIFLEPQKEQRIDMGSISSAFKPFNALYHGNNRENAGTQTPILPNTWKRDGDSIVLCRGSKSYTSFNLESQYSSVSIFNELFNSTFNSDISLTNLDVFRLKDGYLNFLIRCEEMLESTEDNEMKELLTHLHEYLELEIQNIYIYLEAHKFGEDFDSFEIEEMSQIEILSYIPLMISTVLKYPLDILTE